ncbi:hypothetical protein CEUSTIGMA_g5293.t1 [Chlamydomonas eustigma]|uniref:Uncharacterized protein n=1 Tax=Chlamydomonas eustigma TaxID=1157962 RepID=A0A250X455_9CHLO|nr:hypothetical protein CEUSTIGMA_g5293.t1 [Chlamydomonas eustigma]|eukprot:GAX77851.1 hypothetical protein CEUSTIGMA_g5293.t1 [Chlamydomonas eustigma]
MRLGPLNSIAVLLMGTCLLKFVQSNGNLTSWCTQPQNDLGSSGFCNATNILSTCQTVDGWWTRNQVAVIPGSPLSYPNNTSPDMVICGQNSTYSGTVVGTLNVGFTGTQLGSFYAFRGYNNLLYLTVLTDGAYNGFQPFLESGTITAPTNVLSIGVAGTFAAGGPAAAYSNIPFPAAGQYTGFTFALNLAAVCNATSSTYSPNYVAGGFCVCKSGYSTCPTIDLSGVSPIYFSIAVNASLYLPSTTSCGTFQAYTTITQLGAYYSAAQCQGATQPPLPPSPPPAASAAQSPLSSFPSFPSSKSTLPIPSPFPPTLT